MVGGEPMTSQLKVDRISPANGSAIIIEGGISEPLTRSVEEEQLRTSVINKIATNLTSDEKAWLEENL